MVERLIRCIQCNRVLPQPQVLGDFHESFPLPGVEWSDEDFVNRKEFDRCHGSHRQEELMADIETLFSEKPAYEPVKVSYFEATNGRQRFAIKRTKEGLDRPAFYEIVPGQMEIANISVEIQDTDIRKQISAEMDPTVLSEEKAQKFIAVLKEEAGRILPHNLQEAIEAIHDGDSSMLAFATLKEMRWEEILDRCAREFEPSELAHLREFIRNNRQPGDVLSLLIQRQMSILPPSKGFASLSR
jgi:hypothetical protein